MKTFHDALADGFTEQDGYHGFRFGPDDRYELAFEPCIFDDQWYVALYDHGVEGEPFGGAALLTEKVVVRPGHERWRTAWTPAVPRPQHFEALPRPQERA